MDVAARSVVVGASRRADPVIGSGLIRGPNGVAAATGRGRVRGDRQASGPGGRTSSLSSRLPMLTASSRSYPSRR